MSLLGTNESQVKKFLNMIISIFLEESSFLKSPFQINNPRGKLETVSAAVEYSYLKKKKIWEKRTAKMFK